MAGLLRSVLHELENARNDSGWLRVVQLGHAVQYQIPSSCFSDWPTVLYCWTHTEFLKFVVCYFTRHRAPSTWRFLSNIPAIPWSWPKALCTQGPSGASTRPRMCHQTSKQLLRCPSHPRKVPAALASVPFGFVLARVRVRERWPAEQGIRLW